MTTTLMKTPNNPIKQMTPHNNNHQSQALNSNIQSQNSNAKPIPDSILNKTISKTIMSQSWWVEEEWLQANQKNQKLEGQINKSVF